MRSDIFNNYITWSLPAQYKEKKTRFNYKKNSFLLPKHQIKMQSYLVLPQIVPFNFGDDEINAMDMVSASCTVNKGDFPINIYWTRNGHKIFSNDGISISRTNQRISILSIESVRDRHAGNYSCVAENKAGSVELSADLWVNGTVNQLRANNHEPASQNAEQFFLVFLI